MLSQEGKDGHSSALVAPLNIQKSPMSTMDTFTHSRRSSSKGSHSVTSHSQSQISPPLTPRSSQEGINPNSPQQPVFHNYLRAFYHYTPNSTASSSSSDESSVTVAIKQGDVILVHSVHPNGWADGTLLASGGRGWLPTNYCEPYNHPTIQNLLNALTNLWDLVREGENGNLLAFTKQDYVRSMIAGIRFFLERTDCLSRDSRMIVADAGLRRMRKGLLGDLSSLVKTAKKFQEYLQLDNALLPVFDHMDELVLKAFKLVTRAVRFLDIWATDAVSLASFDLGDVNIQRPLTPPSDSIDAVVQPSETSYRAAENESSTNGCDSPVPQGPLSSREDWNTSTNQPARKFNRVSVAFSLPSDSDSLQSPVLITPPQSQLKRISLTHRLSYTGKSSSTRQENLASERLNIAHDAFLGFIASFIGLHLQSRSSEELAELTEQSVIACQQLLVVVTEVWERDSRRSKPLKEARENMHTRLSELVQATKDMFSLTDAEVSAESVADSGKQLVAAATSCVRSAGDCVTKARLVIETTGDFEFETAGLGLSDAIFQQLRPLEKPKDDTAEVSWPLESTPNTKRPLHARPAIKNLIPPPLILTDSKRALDAPQSCPLENSKLGLQLPQAPVSVDSPIVLSIRSSVSSLPAQSVGSTPVLTPPSSVESLDSPITPVGEVSHSSTKVTNITMHAADSGTTNFSMPGGPGSAMSHPSTRATTPDNFPTRKPSNQTLMSSFGSSSELRSLASDDVSAGEEHLLETTYVHELVYNKEGQISGGSLPALVEQLTTYESTPDVVFVTAFYLTFRLFTTPIELAQCLIDRFDYIGGSQSVGIPVRLRVYNVFKGWLESHWSGESDSCALSLIRTFASGRLASAMPTAGKRLAELTAKVTEVRAGALVPRLVSSIGKTGISNVVFTPADSNVPSSNITKSQLNALRASKEGKSQCSILDFDPLELARQFTIIESKLFCAIQPEELLALEWTKKNDSKAYNVKAMSTLSTDLANLVADTILLLEDAKKRAVVIKQWVKIAMKCLDLNNYDSLMAIICSLNSSMVMRLKRTWELVSAKTKARLEELKTVTDVGRNYAVLRQRLHNHVAPCLPFVGIYLTDLTFVDVGNGTTRQLPGDSGSNSVSVINFDKHMKTAKIIGQLQSFQVPYRLAAIPEMQDWMEAQIQRVRNCDQANVQSYYRRSLLLEPREAQHSNKHSPSIDNGSFTTENRNTSRDKFEFLNFNFSTSSTKG